MLEQILAELGERRRASVDRVLRENSALRFYADSFAVSRTLEEARSIAALMQTVIDSHGESADAAHGA